MEDAATLFSIATGGMEPYPYQLALAEMEHLPPVWSVPTGAGKTLAIALAWLWRRRGSRDLELRMRTPRRLVYCLPTRSLVSQTYGVFWSALANLGWLGPNDGPPPNVDGSNTVVRGNGTTEGPSAGRGIRLQYLMGGHAGNDWTLYPEDDAVLIGTQDMLLSRALNRGYGMSRFRWPVAFGLLNSDTLWVCDEVQLMGAGLPTTRQLQAFRDELGTAAASRTVWMSATLEPHWLHTVDNPEPTEADVFTIDVHKNPQLRSVLNANKALRQVPGDRTATPASLVDWMLDSAHQKGTQTLVIVNTVDRAKGIYGSLQKALRNRDASPDLLLLHSRFREEDRVRGEGTLRKPVPPNGRIVVSTQVVEAGTDITSDALVTDLAPWPSLVQRFGRCNRDGTSAIGAVYWIDVEPKGASPYREDEMDQAREVLRTLEGQSVSSADLPPVTVGPSIHDWLRRRDLLQLFDTAPDLSGNDVDVSRFIRDDERRDVHVFWRAVAADGPNGAADYEFEAAPLREELCAVPLGDLRKFLSRQGIRAWVWDHVAGLWVKADPRHLRPGWQVLVDAACGGYLPDLGWSRDAHAAVAPIAGVRHDQETMGSDPRSFDAAWQSIAEHTDAVRDEMTTILERLDLPADWRKILETAVRYHDWGKAHQVFQETMRKSLGKGPEAEEAWMRLPQATLWAKAGGPHRSRHARRHFRHELASALAYLGVFGESPRSDLVAYLIAAHHGRVRSSIRSVPGEDLPALSGAGNQPARDVALAYALGVRHGDHLPATDLGSGIRQPEVTLDLSPMQMGVASMGGSPSWADRVLRLLGGQGEGMGPFRLAYLEALVRAADARGSAARAGPGDAKQVCYERSAAS